jgi:hypothetical protein
VGAAVLLLASGLSIVRHGAVPKWLGWVAILLAIIAMTPLGFVGFLGGAVWILITSIYLTLRLRGEAPSSAGAERLS